MIASNPDMDISRRPAIRKPKHLLTQREEIGRRRERGVFVLEGGGTEYKILWLKMESWKSKYAVTSSDIRGDTKVAT